MAANNRWFRKGRWLRTGWTLGPWHLTTYRSESRAVNVGECNVDSYTSREQAQFAIHSIYELPEGKVCPKCKASALRRAVESRR